MIGVHLFFVEVLLLSCSRITLPISTSIMYVLSSLPSEGFPVSQFPFLAPPSLISSAVHYPFHPNVCSKVNSIRYAI